MGSGILEFTIPFIPPSINTAYRVSYQKKRYHLSNEVYKFRRDAFFFIPKMEVGISEVKQAFEMDVYDNWYYKNGLFRKLDVQNLAKVTIDTVYKKWQEGDEGIWKLVLTKIQDKENPRLNIRSYIIE